MNRFFDIAQFLVSSWALVGQHKLPTSDGILDNALKTACDRGSLPDWVSNELHFADLRTGLRCIELPAILEWAQNGELTSAPNPSYRSAEIKVSDRVAKVILRRLNVQEEDARKLGEILKEEIASYAVQRGAA